MTCTDGRGWTCCRQMACKRSAVRARLAPPGQRRNSNGSNSEYSRKVQQRRPNGPPYVCSGRASSPGWGCWQDTGFQALNRRWPACHLGKSPSRRSRDSCRLLTARPSWRAMSARDCCRICKWPSRAGHPGGLVGSQEPRVLARAARSLTVARRAGSARRADGVSPALGLLVRCAAQARGCAVARPSAPLGALLRQVRNQARRTGRGRAPAAGWHCCVGRSCTMPGLTRLPGARARPGSSS